MANLWATPAYPINGIASGESHQANPNSLKTGLAVAAAVRWRPAQPLPMESGAKSDRVAAFVPILRQDKSSGTIQDSMQKNRFYAKIKE
jgi:hypothetical protein